MYRFLRGFRLSAILIALIFLSHPTLSAAVPRNLSTTLNLDANGSYSKTLTLRSPFRLRRSVYLKVSKPPKFGKVKAGRPAARGKTVKFKFTYNSSKPGSYSSDTLNLKLFYLGSSKALGIYTINLEPLAVQPTITPVATATPAPMAYDFTLTVSEQSTSSLTLHPADVLTNKSVELVELPQFGTLATSGLDVAYTPRGSFVGHDRATYRLNIDGFLTNTATITIDVIPDRNTRLSFIPPEPSYVLANLRTPVHIRDYSKTAAVIAASQTDATAAAIVTYRRSLAGSLLDSTPPDDPYPSGTGQLNLPSPNSDLADLYASALFDGSGTYVWHGTSYSYAQIKELLRLKIIAFLDKYSDPVKWPNWGPDFTSELIDTSVVAYGFNLLFDAVSETLTVNQKTRYQDALLRNFLTPVKAACFSDPDHTCWWSHSWMNQNLQGNSAIIHSSLLVADKDPELAADLLAQTLSLLPLALNSNAPDGSWFEGAGYHVFAFDGLSYAIEGLQVALGTTFGLEKYPGVKDAYYYLRYMRGPFDLEFNYGARELNTNALSSSISDRRPGFSWGLQSFGASLFDEPLISTSELKSYSPKYFDPRYFVYYDSRWHDHDLTELPNDRLYQSDSLMSLRSDWNDVNSSFVTLLGGRNYHFLGHIQMEMGNFVYDALGERFVHDLGIENYSVPNMEDRYCTSGSSSTQEIYYCDGKWVGYDYYRLNEDGQNIPLLYRGDGTKIRQQLRYNGPAPTDVQNIPRPTFVSSNLNNDESFGVLDLTVSYDPNINNDSVTDVLMDNPPLSRPVTRSWRGEGLIKSKSAFVLRDEIQLKDPGTVVSHFHTTAAVSINSNTVLLTINGKNVLMTVVGPSNAQLSVVNLPSLPYPSWFDFARYPCDQDPSGVRCQLPVLAGLKRVEIKSPTLATSHAISLVFQPYNLTLNSSTRVNTVAPLADWRQGITN